MQPVSASAITAGQAQGGNALGLEAVNQTWFVLDVGWSSPAADTVAHKIGMSLSRKVEDAAARAKRGAPYIFMNDASYDEPVIASYGRENVRKLRAVQRIYDPGEVFQKLVRGGFKLPRD